MKILFVIWADPPTTDYPLFLAKAWSKAGHEVLIFPPDLECFNLPSYGFFTALGVEQDIVFRAVFVRRLRKACQTFRPDILIYGGAFVDPRILLELRSQYACQLIHIIGYNTLFICNVAQYVKSYDALFVLDSYLIPLLRGSSNGKNPNVFWMPSCADQEEHCRVPMSSTDRMRYGADVVFVGHSSDRRVAALKTIRDTNLAILGDRAWLEIPELKPFVRLEPIYGLKKTKLYNASRIVLDIPEPDKEINSITHRVTEALACGSLIITEVREDMARYGFQNGESIVAYQHVEEIPELVRHYLQHGAERQAIIEKGRALVLENWTYDRYAAEMMKQIQTVIDTKCAKNPVA